MTTTLAPEATEATAASGAPQSAVLTRLSQSIGATVDGVRLGGDLDRDTVEWLRTQLAVHKVLIVRGQQHLTDESQYAFAKLLGTPTLAHPTVVSRSSHGGDNLVLEGAANAWHTDVSFVDRIPKISILRAVQLPEYGGATEWANTVAAYNRLPAPLRDLADKLWAVHTNDYDYAAAKNRDAKDASGLSYAEFTKVRFETEHPLVHVHPATGERSLLLGQFVSHLSGLHSDESTDLIRLFQARILKPDNTVRWHWEDGDVALWDNLATQHYGVADFGTQPRLNHRVTLAGTVPVSVDGERSRTVSGDASDYSVIDDAAPLVGYPGDIADR